MTETPEIKNWKQPFKCKYCQQISELTVSDIRYINKKEGTPFLPDWQYVTDCRECTFTNILGSLPSNIAVFVQFNSQNA